MASLMRWISRTASTWACSFATRAVAAYACALAAFRSRLVRACARSARDYVNKQTEQPSDLLGQSNPKQEIKKLDMGPYLQHACRMDLPGPTTSVGTRTNYSVGPWDYPTCAARHLLA
jgi:hypothetical protein